MCRHRISSLCPLTLWGICAISVLTQLIQFCFPEMGTLFAVGASNKAAKRKMRKEVTRHEKNSTSPGVGPVPESAGGLRRQRGRRGVGAERQHDLRHGLCGSGRAVCRGGHRPGRDGDQGRQQQQGGLREGQRGRRGDGGAAPVHLRHRSGQHGPGAGPAGPGADEERPGRQGKGEGQL